MSFTKKKEERKKEKAHPSSGDDTTAVDHAREFAKLCDSSLDSRLNNLLGGDINEARAEGIVAEIFGDFCAVIVK